MKKILMSVAIIICCLMSAPSAMSAEKIHSLELGPETTYLSFKQSSSVVKEYGTLYGIYGIYTFAPQVDNWTTELLNVFKVEGRYNYGQPVYTAAGDKYVVRDSLWEARFLAGKKFSPWGLSLTPYAGYGYRFYLREGERDAGFTDDHYDYSYIPIGVNLRKEFKSGWNVGVNLEYDHLLRGYYFAPVGDFSDSINTFSHLNNTHKEGHGLRLSFHVEKKIGSITFVLTPYMNYWHIDESNITVSYANGTPFDFQNGKVIARETGLRLGIRF